MKIEITSKHTEVTAAMRDRIESRFEKLERYTVDFIKSHVIITQEPQGFKIEANISIPHNKLFAQAQDDDLYTAINQMGQKLQRQLNKITHKDDSHRSERQAKSLNREEPVFENAEVA